MVLQCRVLKVSSAGYYKWRSSTQSEKQLKDQSLIDLIQVLHKESYGAYGIRRIVRELKRQGITVNQKRIRRLMKSLGIQGKNAPKKRYIATTDSNHTNPVAENYLKRQFLQEAPNRAWVSDITYIWTENGWLYLAVIIDLFSRMVVGWHTSTNITTDLICMALQKAVVKRKPPPGVLLHSDRGVQYTSERYRLMTAQYGIIQSMSRKGNCWDNSVAESFFRSLKVEALKGYTFNTRSEAESRIFKYIEDFYNKRRAHSFLQYLSPEQFELAGVVHRNSKIVDSS